MRSIEGLLKEENIQPGDIIILELNNRGEPSIERVVLKYKGDKKVVLSPRVTIDISDGWYMSYRITGIKVLERAGNY